MRLIEEAKKAGFTEVELAALVRNQEEYLLIQDSGQTEFHLPTANVKDGESITEALQRGIDQVGLLLKEVVTYLRHIDRENVRQYIFVVEVLDTYAVKHAAFAWVNSKDGSGYPISDELRATLNIL